jgi:hypothetical protein
LKYVYYAFAIALLGHYMRFTQRLGDEQVRKGLEEREEGLLNWIRQRINDELHKEFRRKVDYVMALEGQPSKGKQFHLHGALSVTLDEEDRAEQALLKAGGKLPKPFEKHAVKVQIQSRVMWWPGYTAKKTGRTIEELAAAGGKPHSVIARSLPVQQRAKALYREHRDMILAARRAAS